MLFGCPPVWSQLMWAKDRLTWGMTQLPRARESCFRLSKSPVFQLLGLTLVQLLLAPFSDDAAIVQP